MNRDEMMDDASGAPLSGTGSREPSPAVSAASGFDPSRWEAGSYEGKPRHMPKAERQELGKLLSAAREHIASLTPYRRMVLARAMRSVSPVNCGWQQYRLAQIFVYEIHRDRDASLAEDAQRLSPKGGSPGPQGHRQKPNPHIPGQEEA